MEKNETDSLNDLLDNFDKQRSIDTATDWQRLHRRIVAGRNRRVAFHILRNVAAILFPLFLVAHYIVVPAIGRKNKSETTVVVAKNGRSKITLADGSCVWLNASSKLSYPKEFGKKERTVNLSGEAYFEVSASKDRKFNVVVNNKMIVSAYGTEFNINSNNKQNEYQVVLSEGNLDVELPDTHLKQQLQPGQQAIVSPKTNEISIDKADVYKQTAWKDGKMVFYRERLEDIAKELSAKFDVTIEFANETTKNQRYTGTFTTESVTEILDLFKETTAMDYTVLRTSSLRTKTTKRTIKIY